LRSAPFAAASASVTDAAVKTDPTSPILNSPEVVASDATDTVAEEIVPADEILAPEADARVESEPTVMPSEVKLPSVVIELAASKVIVPLSDVVNDQAPATPVDVESDVKPERFSDPRLAADAVIELTNPEPDTRSPDAMVTVARSAADIVRLLTAPLPVVKAPAGVTVVLVPVPVIETESRLEALPVIAPYPMVAPPEAETATEVSAAEAVVPPTAPIEMSALVPDAV